MNEILDLILSLLNELLKLSHHNLICHQEKIVKED